MTGRDGGQPAVAGGLAPHVPVLAREAIDSLAPRPGGRYLDATFGAGGYSRRLLAVPDAQVIGLDRDQTAVAAAADLVEASEGRLRVTESRFSELETAMHTLGWSTLDGVAFDLGVSSMQLDQAARGFSFRSDGPLDMRMGGEGPSAADLVAVASERDLAAVIATLGEERHARAVARAIGQARRQAPITTTGQLADIVSRVVHMKPGDIHPATRTFQALRMCVNEELEEIALGLAAAERVLSPGGRLAVVSFHSLEDRIVKTFLVERSRQPSVSRHQPEAAPVPSTFSPLTRKPIVPDAGELAANPRARSAKLRSAERTAAAARPLDIPHLLPRVPRLPEIMQGKPS